MDNSTKKWLIRAGSLLIVLGFFVPSVAVSCSLAPNAAQYVSMNDLASGSYLPQPLLYFVLLGAVAALVMALIQPRNGNQRYLYVLGEITGLGVGVLSILITLISLSGQMQQAGLAIKPSAGSLILLTGYGLAAFGIFMEFTQSERYGPAHGYHAPPSDPQPVSSQIAFPPPRQQTGAHLRLAHGTAPAHVAINQASFKIGRSHRNDLVLNDPQISSVHVAIKYANGTWFIQEQGSSNGTLVNGKKLAAQPLRDGDKIKMGTITYIFHT